MAFNFNWSPLTADSSFYSRARELLTNALNKSPKPPIIVDDIIVNELNLGSTPPDLDILEIGDLAEDRFRGIFKMCYSGDAFLTLKTRVQANPLNTYLLTRPGFASPQPLAAASSLTIPLQITLSEIRLSAFIILVFSKQKGITLVFRNDPLESLKVSSTFDSIPFVRDYLQKEIEGQLRTLLMEEVPAIIHRLSLRLWVPGYRTQEEEECARDQRDAQTREETVDPLADPPQDPVDHVGNILNPAQLTSLALDTGSESHSLFSRRNLVALAALQDSHNTLSLFTPTMRDVVYRAWAGPTERGEKTSSITPALSRSQSYTGNTSNTYVFSDNSQSAPQTSRPLLSKHISAASGLSLGSNRSGNRLGGRKRKHRVVDLRKKKDNGEGISDGLSTSDDANTVITDTTSSVSTSDFAGPHSAPIEREGELVTPPSSPPQSPRSIQKGRHMTPRHQHWRDPIDMTPRQPSTGDLPIADSSLLESHTHRQTSDPYTKSQIPLALPRTQSASSLPVFTFPPSSSSSSDSSTTSKPSIPLLPTPTSYLTPEMLSGTILEQAWVMKMADEVAQRVEQEKTRNRGFWERKASTRSDQQSGLGIDVDGRGPPPAYKA